MTGRTLSLSLGLSSPSFSGGTPTPTPTPAPVITFDGTTFSNANGDPGPWQADGAAIPGETGATMAYVETTMAGRAIRQDVGGVLSNAVVVTASTAPSTLVTFDAGDGTRWDAMTQNPPVMIGGDATQRAKYTVQSNYGQTTGLAAAGTPATYPQAIWDAQDKAHRIGFITRSTGVDEAPPVVLSGVDEQNFVLGRTNLATNDAWLEGFVGNASTGNIPSSMWVRHPALGVPGTLLEFEKRADNYARILINGKQYQANKTTPVEDPTAWYPLPGAVANGQKVGVSSRSSSTKRIDNLSFTSLSEPITLSTTSIGSEIVGGALKRFILLGGTCFANHLNNAEVLLLDDGTGEMLTDWTAAPGAPGAGTTFSIKAYFSPNAYGRSVEVVLRDTVLKGEAATATITVPIYEEIEPLVFGVNSIGTQSYSSSDLVRNRARTCRWFYKDASNNGIEIPPEDFNADGWPVGPIPAPYSRISAFLFEGPPAGTRNGVWDVTVNVDCAISTFQLSNMTASATTARSVKLTTSDPSLGQVGLVAFLPSSIPSEGLQVNCVLSGDTRPATDLVPAELESIWHKDLFGGELWLRDMKDTDAEFMGSPPGKLRFAGRPEYAVSASRQLGANIHHNPAWTKVADELQTTVRGWIEHFRDNAPASAKLAVSVGNEIWNTGYDAQFAAMFIRAVNSRSGLFDGATIPVGVTVTDERAFVDPNTGATSRIFQPGEWFFCRTLDQTNPAKNYQFALMECVSATPVSSGVILPYPNSDASFATRAVYDPIFKSVRRFQSRLQSQLGALGKEILGDRFVSVLECNSRDNLDDLRDFLLFEDAWQNVDAYSPGFYGLSGSNEYSANAWAQAYADLPTFKPGFFAKQRAGSDVIINILIAMKHGMRARLLTAGVPANRCPKMDHLYEGGDHNTIYNIPSADRAGVVTAINECVKDPQQYTETAYFLSELHAKIGGIIMWFADTEYPRWNNGGNQAQFFGMRQRQFDSAINDNGAEEQRYLAARAAFGGGA